MTKIKSEHRCTWERGYVMSNELAAFHSFVGNQLQSGQEGLSPEDALEMWRDQHPDSAAEDDTEAVREALADLAAGDRGVSIEEADREFRQRFPKR